MTRASPIRLNHRRDGSVLQPQVSLRQAVLPPEAPWRTTLDEWCDSRVQLWHCIVPTLRFPFCVPDCVNKHGYFTSFGYTFQLYKLDPSEAKGASPSALMCLVDDVLILVPHAGDELKFRNLGVKILNKLEVPIKPSQPRVLLAFYGVRMDTAKQANDLLELWNQKGVNKNDEILKLALNDNPVLRKEGYLVPYRRDLRLLFYIQNSI